jgi:hypothetical protein
MKHLESGQFFKKQQKKNLDNGNEMKNIINFKGVWFKNVLTHE